VEMMEKGKIIFLILIVFIIPGPLSARGAIESEREYQNLLKSTFNHVILSVENGEISADEGKQTFAELRNRYNKYYSDEAGIIDALIDQVGEKALTSEEALFDFTLLSEGRLMEHRLDLENNKEENQKEEHKPGEPGKGNGEGGEQQRRSS